MKNWLERGVNYQIAVWIGLSIVLIICISLFRINDFIAHPQHGHFEHVDAINAIIFSQEHYWTAIWFKTFFVLDFFWAAFLLLIVAYFIRTLLKSRFFTIGSKTITAGQIYFTAVILLLIIEIIEALAYGYKGVRQLISLELIVSIKLGLYVICALFFLYWALQRFIFPKAKNFIRFLQTSLLSVLFIIIIYLLVTAMPQGGTLLVTLFYSPLNILFLFFLLTFLAILLSHFPVYVDIWLYGDRDCVSLNMSKRHTRILGFGIIYYGTHRSSKEKKNEFNNEDVKMLRRSLGVLIYGAVFHIFIALIPRYFEIYFDTVKVTFFLLIITYVIYYVWGQMYNNWKHILDKSDQVEIRRTIATIVKYVRFFPWYFGLCTLMVLTTAVLAMVYQWSVIPLIFMLVTIICQMYLYIYFKICRTFFKYVFYSNSLYKRNSDMFDATTLELFKKYAKVENQKVAIVNRQFAKLSDNISYLNLMRWSGIFSFVTIVAANIWIGFSSALNPINIIILYIILFYSFIILLWKHVLYYYRLREEKKALNFFRFGIPLIVFSIIGWCVYSAGQPNNLHSLSLTKAEPRLEFTDFLKNKLSQNTEKKPNYFFVGSYGGGLKANLWNLLLLNRLDEISEGDFMKRTVVMSGVSGGAVGIGNYSALVANEDDPSRLREAIERIGVSNVLSTELTYLMGWDMLREYAHFGNYRGKDRSYYSMQKHAKNVGMPLKDYNSYGFSEYWERTYDKRKRKYPLLIMNTTSVAGRQGVVATVRFSDSTFAGADNLTQFYDNETGSNVTLTYYGAVSTTNRFPLFSPTAKIRGQGSYLDGGYFENSGMLSALEVYDAIQRDDDFVNKIQPVFINIINSKNFYIEEKLIEWGFEASDLKDSGELASIIGTVVSIDKLPRYVYNKIENRGFAVVPIMMPHKLSYTDVQAVIKAKVKDPLRLMDSIEVHNKIIDDALHSYERYKRDAWGVVEPPLARILGEPAVRYQEAMIYFHTDLDKTMERVFSFIETDTLVTDQNKNTLRRPTSKYRRMKSKTQGNIESKKDSL